MPILDRSPITSEPAHQVQLSAPPKPKNTGAQQPSVYVPTSIPSEKPVDKADKKPPAAQQKKGKKEKEKETSSWPFPKVTTAFDFDERAQPNKGKPSTKSGGGRSKHRDSVMLAKKRTFGAPPIDKGKQRGVEASPERSGANHTLDQDDSHSAPGPSDYRGLVRSHSLQNVVSSGRASAASRRSGSATGRASVQGHSPEASRSRVSVISAFKEDDEPVGVGRSVSGATFGEHVERHHTGKSTGKPQLSCKLHLRSACCVCTL